MNRIFRQVRQPLGMFYLSSVIIIAINVLLIVNQLYWLAWALPVLLIVAFFFIFSLDNVLYFIVLLAILVCMPICTACDLVWLALD